jgi:hypothetical protein
MPAPMPDSQPQSRQARTAANNPIKDYAFRVDLALPATDWDHWFVDLIGEELFMFPMDHDSRSELSAPYGDDGSALLSVWFAEKEDAAAYSNYFREHLHRPA